MRLFLLGTFLVFFGCTNRVSEEDLQNLNGYWEIDQVMFSNGETKTFNASTTIDYIEWDGNSGFRKKMQPKFDGTFQTSNDAESFLILLDKDMYIMHYKNGETERKEKILEISTNSLTVINTDTLTYRYKRFVPIDISHGETQE